MRKKKIGKNYSNSYPGLLGILGGAHGIDNISGANYWQTTVNQLWTVLKHSRFNLISNNRYLLSNLYTTNAIVRRHIDGIVDDALRGGVEIKSEELDSQDIRSIIYIMSENKDLHTISQVLKWAALYGGSGIVISDGLDDDIFSIDEVQLGDKVDLIPATLWELRYYDYRNYGTDGKPPYYDEGNYNYDFYNKIVHPSKVIKVMGKIAPPETRSFLWGWGVSEVESIIAALNQYLKNNEASFELLDQSSTEIYKFNGLNDAMLTDQGTARIASRLQSQASIRSFKRSLAIDMEDDFVQRSMDFAGLSNMHQTFMITLAAYLGRPLTKLFGISVAGFNSGDHDIENYNAIVDNFREEYKYIILKVIQIRCKQLFGYIPSDLNICFKSLRVLTAEQQETIKDRQFERLMRLEERGYINSEDFVSQCNAAQLTPLDIKYNDIFIRDSDRNINVDGSSSDKSVDQNRQNKIFSKIKSIFKNG